MDSELLQVKSGEMTFDRFAYLTRAYWRKVAADLLDRWDVPPAVGADDVVQELLVAVWRAIGEHREGGMPLRQFVVRRALWSCQRWIHQQRGAWGWQGGRPSRHAIGVDSIDQYGGDGQPRQERALEILEAMRCARSAKDRAVLERLLSCGGVDQAADDLYSRPDERLRWEFDNRGAARRSVYRSVLRMARAAETGDNGGREAAEGAR